MKRCPIVGWEAAIPMRLNSMVKVPDDVETVR